MSKITLAAYIQAELSKLPGAAGTPEITAQQTLLANAIATAVHRYLSLNVTVVVPVAAGGVPAPFKLTTTV